MKKIAMVMLLIALAGPAGIVIAQENGEPTPQREGQAVPTPSSYAQQPAALVQAGADMNPTEHELYVTAYRVAQQAARGAEDPDASLRALQERIKAKAAYIQQALRKTQETSR